MLRVVSHSFVYRYKMHCFMCFCSDEKLQMFESNMGNETTDRITSVLPDFLIPDSMEPVFICSTCLEQISFFYTIKKAGLQNCSRLKYFNALLKGTNNSKSNELRVIINSDQLSARRKHHMQFKVNPESKYLLSLEEQNTTHFKNEDDYYSQQFVNDETSSDYLQDDESSCSSDVSTRNDSNLTCNNSRYEYQPETNFECEKKRFKPSNLQQHTCVHTREKPFKCITCQKTFTQLAHLNRPTLTHTSKKSHEYDVCNKSFNEKSRLIIHKQFHNNVHPYKCAMSSEAFVQSSDLNTHIHTYTGEKSDQYQTQRDSQEKKFKCTECHKTFTKRSNLERHTLVHTGEKPYKCTTCQKTFTQLASLNTHKLIHTGERPHECDVCHKTFNQKSNLITHKRLHNNVIVSVRCVQQYIHNV